MADHLFEGGPGDLAPVMLRRRAVAEPDPHPAPLPRLMDDRAGMIDAAAFCVAKLDWWGADQACRRWKITWPELRAAIGRLKL